MSEELEKLKHKKSYIDNTFPGFIFDGVRLSISRSRFPFSAKIAEIEFKCIDIFADNIVYYVID